MAKPEYAIREVSLAEVILFLLSAIILAAYHFDYRVATYIIFLGFFSVVQDYRGITPAYGNEKASENVWQLTGCLLL